MWLYSSLLFSTFLFSTILSQFWNSVTQKFLIQISFDNKLNGPRCIRCWRKSATSSCFRILKWNLVTEVFDPPFGWNIFEAGIPSMVPECIEIETTLAQKTVPKFSCFHALQYGRFVVAELHTWEQQSSQHIHPTDWSLQIPFSRWTPYWAAIATHRQSHIHYFLYCANPNCGSCQGSRSKSVHVL